MYMSSITVFIQKPLRPNIHSLSSYFLGLLYARLGVACAGRGLCKLARV